MLRLRRIHLLFILRREWPCAAALGWRCHEHHAPRIIGAIDCGSAVVQDDSSRPNDKRIGQYA
ncbi:hypothetical protein BMONG18_0828 [Bifidobacterium mongoliense]|uniref:Uncharacterized protein n=1 Tax=Bifidobacterium mongoliense TaxID=518643 RepID=A0A423UEU9_9BIFI|nr:hypothetical protein BMONG18_0828 [Bifidobacterium mongoliense]